MFLEDEGPFSNYPEFPTSPSFLNLNLDSPRIQQDNPFNTGKRTNERKDSCEHPQRKRFRSDEDVILEDVDHLETDDLLEECLSHLNQNHRQEEKDVVHLEDPFHISDDDVFLEKENNVPKDAVRLMNTPKDIVRDYFRKEDDDLLNSDVVCDNEMSVVVMDTYRLSRSVLKFRDDHNISLKLISKMIKAPSEKTFSHWLLYPQMCSQMNSQQQEAYRRLNKWMGESNERKLALLNSRPDKELEEIKEPKEPVEIDIFKLRFYMLREMENHLLCREQFSEMVARRKWHNVRQHFRRVQKKAGKPSEALELIHKWMCEPLVTRLSIVNGVMSSELPAGILPPIPPPYSHVTTLLMERIQRNALRTVVLDTSDLVENILKQLSTKKYSRDKLAMKIVGIDPPTLDNLLNHPIPWNNLDMARKNAYWCLHKWLEQPENVQKWLLGLKQDQAARVLKIVQPNFWVPEDGKQQIPEEVEEEEEVEEDEEDSFAIDTAHLVSQVNQEMFDRKISFARLAEPILARSPTVLSRLLKSPTPWLLAKPATRHMYERLQKWMEQTPLKRLEILQLDPFEAAKILNLPSPKPSLPLLTNGKMLRETDKKELLKIFKTHGKPKPQMWRKIAGKLRIDAQLVRDFFEDCSNGKKIE